jgi:hypothetical protein
MSWFTLSTLSESRIKPLADKSKRIGELGSKPFRFTADNVPHLLLIDTIDRR